MCLNNHHDLQQNFWIYIPARQRWFKASAIGGLKARVNFDKKQLFAVRDREKDSIMLLCGKEASFLLGGYVICHNNMYYVHTFPRISTKCHYKILLVSGVLCVQHGLVNFIFVKTWTHSDIFYAY